MNIDFFKKIDTEEKAYWLGFIAADGYVNKRGNTVGISLDIKDIEHLKKFQKALGGLGTLFTRKSRYSIKHRETTKCVLEVYRRSMCKDLSNLGITSTKTVDLQPPILQKEIIQHYIRGFFDGDGCICESKTKYQTKKGVKLSIRPRVTFVGTLPMMSFVKENIPSPLKNIVLDKRTKETYILDYNSTVRTIPIHSYFYKDATIFLDRKKEKFDSFLESVETIPEGSTT